MARQGNKLTAQEVASKNWRPGVYADGHGLYLQVAPGGSKSWLFRFMRDGVARKMGLGATHTVSLSKARERAAEARLKLLDGNDPIEHKRAARSAARLAAAKALTFRQCAEKYITAKQAEWKNEKHAAQWPSTLQKYVYPILKDTPVGQIDVALVLKVLEKDDLWTTKPETASRVRGRIEKVLDWASSRGYRTGDNPARWQGHLQNLLPARSKVARVKHHAALPYRDVAAFMADLRALDGVSPRALEFAILTVGRTGEVIGARWSEIDLKERMWTIPGSRMKAGREHRVPLSDRSVQLLEDLPRDGDVVFSAGTAKPLSNMALLMTLRRMGRSNLTAHGFRSTFRDWTAEQTAYPHELCEMALAHAVSDT